VQAAAAARIVIRLTAFHLKVYVLQCARSASCVFIQRKCGGIAGRRGFSWNAPFFLGPNWPALLLAIALLALLDAQQKNVSKSKKETRSNKYHNFIRQ